MPYIQTPPLFYPSSRGIPSVTEKKDQEIRFKNPSYHLGQSQSLKDIDISTAVYQIGLFFSRASAFVKMNFLTFYITTKESKSDGFGLFFFFFLTISFSLRWLIFIWRVCVVNQSRVQSENSDYCQLHCQCVHRWN